MEEKGSVKEITDQRRRSLRWIAVLLFVLLLAASCVFGLMKRGTVDERRKDGMRPAPYLDPTEAPTPEPTEAPTAEPTTEPTEPPATPEPTQDYRKTAIIIEGETAAVLASREAAEELLRNVEDHFLTKGGIPDDAVTELLTEVRMEDAPEEAEISAYDEVFAYLTGRKTPLKYKTVVTYFEYKTVSHRDTVITDHFLPAGIRVVRLYGRDGVERRTYNTVYYNGEKQSTREVEKVTVIEPVNGDIRVGLREFPEDYTLRRSFGSNPVAAFSLDMKVPMHGDVIALYGPYAGGFCHGIDISSPDEDTVRAAAKGTVVSVMERGAYGLMVEIQHINSVTTRYALLGEALVSVGDTVEAGDVIGKAALKDGAAVLHFELRIRGTAYNPLKILSVYDIKASAS